MDGAEHGAGAIHRRVPGTGWQQVSQEALPAAA
jgi:hypothetical protein